MLVWVSNDCQSTYCRYHGWRIIKYQIKVSLLSHAAQDFHETSWKRFWWLFILGYLLCLFLIIINNIINFFYCISNLKIITIPITWLINKLLNIMLSYFKLIHSISTYFSLLLWICFLCLFTLFLFKLILNNFLFRS